jgi:ribosomal protein S18 acetylase RimI-like enzyme
MHEIQIVRATQAHVPGVARLFDLYRQFYQCEPDLELAADFIGSRMGNDESAIFVALTKVGNEAGNGAGFVQMYPSFCSVEAVKIQILYDLYVDEDFRKQGLGRKLMERATRYARESGAARLDLLTAKDNFPGQALYESLGYAKTNEDFFAFSLDAR